MSAGFILNLSSEAMVRGWWWIKDPEELYCILQALHPRGVRERVLHKHLAKHMESLAEMCTRPISGECWQNVFTKFSFFFFFLSLVGYVVTVVVTLDRSLV